MKRPLLSIVAWSFAAYMIPFLLALVDEFLLDTNLLTNHAPDWLTQAFELIYWPLIEVVRRYLFD